LKDSYRNTQLQSILQTKKENVTGLYVLLAVSGLATHAGAFWLSVLMVPRYATELNPLPSNLGMVPYFFVTLPSIAGIYYVLWVWNTVDQKSKIVLASFATGLCILDFLVDVEVLLASIL
jgi:hypothetical protein